MSCVRAYDSALQLVGTCPEEYPLSKKQHRQAHYSPRNATHVRAASSFCASTCIYGRGPP